MDRGRRKEGSLEVSLLTEETRDAECKGATTQTRKSFEVPVHFYSSQKQKTRALYGVPDSAVDNARLCLPETTPLRLPHSSQRSQPVCAKPYRLRIHKSVRIIPRLFL